MQACKQQGIEGRRPGLALALLTVMAANATAADGTAAASAAPREARCEARSSVDDVKGQRFTQAFSAPAQVCGSLRAVLKRLFSREAAAGRKLEKDRPLNLDSARREYKTAMADPALAAQLKTLQAEESDPLRRRALEAALLDEQGHYEARDLVLREIATELGL